MTIRPDPNRSCSIEHTHASFVACRLESTLVARLSTWMHEHRFGVMADGVGGSGQVSVAYAQ